MPSSGGRSCRATGCGSRSRSGAARAVAGARARARPSSAISSSPKPSCCWAWCPTGPRSIRPRSSTPRAQIGEGTTIGPHAIVGANVRIGANCRIGASAVIDGWTEIGDDTEIYPFASIGLIPQDLKFKGEETKLVIGRRNIFREFVTINRGTRGGGGVT